MKFILISFLVLVLMIVSLVLVIIALKKHDNEFEKELEALKKENEMQESYNREINKTNEKLEEVHSGNGIDNFNAGIELLQEQSKKGKQRNSNNS